jgi:hypothetical protein
MPVAGFIADAAVGRVVAGLREKAGDHPMITPEVSLPSSTSKVPTYCG